MHVIVSGGSVNALVRIEGFVLLSIYNELNCIEIGLRVTDRWCWHRENHIRIANKKIHWVEILTVNLLVESQNSSCRQHIFIVLFFLII